MKDTLRIWLIIVWANVCYTLPAQTTFISGMEKLKWERIMPGIWKASFGQQGINPLDYAAPPKENAIHELSDCPFPFSPDSTFCLLTKERAVVRLPLGRIEKIYGLGLEFQGVNRRENVYELKVDHYGKMSGYTHAPIPFYISSKGYGVLFNSAKRVKIYAGNGNRKDSHKPEPVDRTSQPERWSDRPVSDAVEASVQGEGLELFIFTGKTILEVVQRYNLFLGGGAMPPKWGLGFWHRMHTKSAAKDVLSEIEDFRKNHFPLDVIGLEPGWQSFAYPCSYDWDSLRFQNPANFVKELLKQNIRVNLWENPYVATVSTMYDSIKPFTGSHTVWLGEVPDYTLPDARRILINHHKRNHLDIGVSGYKIDETDGYDFWLWPDHATFPSGNDAVEIRQLYGLILQKTFTDYFRGENKRTYGLVRSSYIGSSSYNFVIYSDYYDHKGYVTALINSSLAGVLWTPEIRSAGSSEEWVRRFQTVCFSPLMMLNAWSSGMKPWNYPEVTDIIRDNIELRIKLLPYLYTAFYDYNKRGIPPFRSMLLEAGYAERVTKTDGKLDGVENPYAERKLIEATDQYMMGPYILVAPVFTGQTQRSVILPEGSWFDFYTGKYAGNNEVINISTKLEQIPLFVKDGAIIPMLSDITKDNTAHTLQVRYYGSSGGDSYFLYNDDGQTYNYESGDYTIEELKVEKDKKGELKGKRNLIRDGRFRYGDIEWKWMTD
jgi:alpha-glucosidase (family GH31 glycosyl hydrolase)